MTDFVRDPAVQRPGEESSDSEDENWPPAPPKTNGTSDKEQTNGSPEKKEPEQRPNGAAEPEQTEKADTAAAAAEKEEKEEAPATGQFKPYTQLLRFTGVTTGIGGVEGLQI